MRYTRSDVYAVFRELCKAAGKIILDDLPEPERKTSKTEGAWYLEYGRLEEPGYMICSVTKYETPPDVWQPGVGFPLEYTCRRASEMVRTMQFTISVLKSIKIDAAIRRQAEVIEKGKRLVRELEEEIQGAIEQQWDGDSDGSPLDLPEHLKDLHSH